MLVMFVAVGLVFLLIEFMIKRGFLAPHKNYSELTRNQSLLIGLAQATSVIPGVSRAGSIIITMLILGYKREESAKYTFMLSLPTIAAASLLDLYQGRELLAGSSTNLMVLVVGSLVSLFVAYFVVKWLIRYLSVHTLEIFGWYRLAVALILVFLKVLP